MLRYQWFDAGEVPAAKELQAADIVTVLNELKVERADYLGIFDGHRHQTCGPTGRYCCDRCALTISPAKAVVMWAFPKAPDGEREISDSRFGERFTVGGRYPRT